VCRPTKVITAIRLLNAKDKRGSNDRRHHQREGREPGERKEMDPARGPLGRARVLYQQEQVASTEKKGKKKRKRWGLMGGKDSFKLAPKQKRKGERKRSSSLGGAASRVFSSPDGKPNLNQTTFQRTNTGQGYNMGQPGSQLGKGASGGGASEADFLEGRRS